MGEDSKGAMANAARLRGARAGAAGESRPHVPAGGDPH